MSLLLLAGQAEANGRVEVQAVSDTDPPAIAVIECEDYEQALESAGNLHLRGYRLLLIRVVEDGDVRGATYLRREAS